MSLKTIHILLVVTVILASSAYGMWSVLDYLRDSGVASIITAVVLGVGGFALLMHGVIFYKHTENEPWL